MDYCFAPVKKKKLGSESAIYDLLPIMTIGNKTANPGPDFFFGLHSTPLADVGYVWRRLRVSIPENIASLPPDKKPEKLRAYLSGATELHGRLDETYDVRTAYERARRRCDPLLSPHGMFRSLRPGDNYHAYEFLERFGPLNTDLPPGVLVSGCKALGDFFEADLVVKLKAWSPELRARISSFAHSAAHKVIGDVRVNLRKFWELHTLFTQVCQLYESRDDKNKLVEAWREFCEHQPEHEVLSIIWKRIPFRIKKWLKKELPAGAQSKPSARATILRHPKMEKVQPEDSSQHGFLLSRWLQQSGLKCQREAALELVAYELTEQLGIIIPIPTYERWGPSREKFRQSVSIESLWQTLWELFVWDTVGIPWRRCPHCQRVFYPKRRDQYYCTPRQQALASKRAYAARRRAEERRKRRQLQHTRKGANR